jgi:hypothetical protein
MKWTKMWRGGHKIPFDVYLHNEGAEDAGGPMRDTIDSISRELMDDKLVALFCKTANDEAGLYELGGEGRKLNPNFLVQSSLLKYEFIGKMIGWSVCVGNMLPLNLHENFWKVHVAKEKPSLDMLKNEDKYRWQFLNDLIEDKNDPSFDVKYAD